MTRSTLMRRSLLDNQRTKILSLLVLCRRHSWWYCHAPSLPPALSVLWQQGRQWLPNSQHFIKRSWREGESLLWKTSFHNVISRLLVRLTTNHMNLHQFVKKLPFVKEEKVVKKCFIYRFICRLKIESLLSGPVAFLHSLTKDEKMTQVNDKWTANFFSSLLKDNSS